MKRPSLSVGHSYRILAVLEGGDNELIGRLVSVESYATDITLPAGFLSISGTIHGPGTMVKDYPLAVEPVKEEPCRCAAFSFPHKLGPRCLAALS